MEETWQVSGRRKPLTLPFTKCKFLVRWLEEGEKNFSNQLLGKILAISEALAVFL